jgi:TonB family protein
MASQEMLDRAKGLRDRKQYTLALEAVQKVLSSDPENAEALKLKDEIEGLARTADAAGKIDQMLAEAESYLEAKRGAEAQRRLKEILALDPAHREALALSQRLDLESEMELLESEAEGRGLKEGDFVDVGKVDTPPELVKQVAPVYPGVARRMGIEGEARFLATIGIDGTVESTRFLTRIEGWDDMNEAAEKAVRKYRFTPATAGGVKVRTIVNLSVLFRSGQDIRAPYMK